MQTELTQALTALEAAAEAIKKLQAQQPTQPEPQLSIKNAWYEVLEVYEWQEQRGIKKGDIVKCVQGDNLAPYCYLNGKGITPNGGKYSFSIFQLRHLPNYVPPVWYVTEVSKLPYYGDNLAKIEAYHAILRIVVYCNSQFEADGNAWVFDVVLDWFKTAVPKRYGYHFTSRKAIELAKNTPDFIKHFEVWMG